ncbi:MAG: hypothetical protein OXU26_05665 [Acidobacteriota bacterium]|nr:hypothetical protein [Acidobacteriota bacterium]MDE2963376.1 hypothetical protein [Acidobacteriota bacterium]
MSNRWTWAIKEAKAVLGASVTAAVRRLNILQSSERRPANADDAVPLRRETRFQPGRGGFRIIGYPLGAKSGMLRLSLAASALLMFAAASELQGQWRSRAGNPSISVDIEHPPKLPLIAEKIVFGPATGECSNDVVSAMRDRFAARGLEVVDWQTLEPVLSEHDFSFGGTFDRKSVDEMGRILGPSTLLVVEVTRCAAERQRFRSSEKRKDSDSDSTYKVTIYHAKTLALLELSVQTADLTTGRIFDPEMIVHSPSRERKSEDGYPESPSRFELQAIAFKRAARDVGHMVLPRVQKRSLVFFDNKKCNLKAAYQALKGGEEERALNLSLELLDACKNYPDPKIKPKRLRKLLANAHYNAGVMHRIRGDLDAGLEYLLEAERLRPVEIMAEAVADCREAIRVRDAMQGIREETKQAALEFQERLVADEQAQRDNTLTNSGVIALVEMGLPEAIIVKKIETSTCEFDVSAEALVGLTEAGVGERVILSMMEFNELANDR